jgi:hypothetical protein
VARVGKLARLTLVRWLVELWSDVAWDAWLLLLTVKLPMYFRNVDQLSGAALDCDHVARFAKAAKMRASISESTEHKI